MELYCIPASQDVHDSWACVVHLTDVFWADAVPPWHVHWLGSHEYESEPLRYKAAHLSTLERFAVVHVSVASDACFSTLVHLLQPLVTNSFFEVNPGPFPFL